MPPHIPTLLAVAVNTVSRYISYSDGSQKQTERKLSQETLYLDVTAWQANQRIASRVGSLKGIPVASTAFINKQRARFMTAYLKIYWTWRIHDRTVSTLQEISRYEWTRRYRYMVSVRVEFVESKRSTLVYGIAVSPMLECFNTTGRENIQLHADNVRER